FLGPFSINTVIGNSSVDLRSATGLGGPVTSEVQLLTLSGATAGATQVTLTYPDGISNPSTSFTFQNSANDATTLQTNLNALFNGLGFSGNPVTVTRTASTATSASFALAFSGTLASTNVLQLSASASGTASAGNTTLAQGGAPNLTTINPNTQIQVNTPGG